MHAQKMGEKQKKKEKKETNISTSLLGYLASYKNL